MESTILAVLPMVLLRMVLLQQPEVMLSGSLPTLAGIGLQRPGFASRMVFSMEGLTCKSLPNI
jgi:hypothetical protein